MLTRAHVETLKRTLKLIDDKCANRIHQNLDGDPDSAATTLLLYFEQSHSDDELMKFCEFLRTEARRAGSAPALVALPKKIADAVIDKWTQSQGLYEYYYSLIETSI